MSDTEQVVYDSVFGFLLVVVLAVSLESFVTGIVFSKV
jgi:hypothetical protein